MHSFWLLGGGTVMREPVDKCTKIRILLHCLLSCQDIATLSSVLPGYCFLNTYVIYLIVLENSLRRNRCSCMDRPIGTSALALAHISAPNPACTRNNSNAMVVAHIFQKIGSFPFTLPLSNFNSAIILFMQSF